MTGRRGWQYVPFWVAVALLLLAFALRTHTIGVRELTFDEVGSVYIANRSIPSMLAYLRGAIREHPPFYYLLLSLWLPLVGKSEFAVRFLSVCIGVITIAAMYRLTRREASQWEALSSMFLLTASPFHLRISQDARMYGALALWSLLSYFLFLRLLREEEVRHWVLFWLAISLGIATHYFMAFVLIAVDLFLLLYWRRYRHLWGKWLALHTVLAVGIALWTILSPGLGATVLSLWRRGPASSVRWEGLVRALNGLYLGTTRNPNWYHLSLPLLLTAVGVGITFWRGRQVPEIRRNESVLLGLLLVVPMSGILLLPERVTGRYLTSALPASILAMAMAIGHLTRWSSSQMAEWSTKHSTWLVFYRPLLVAVAVCLLLGALFWIDIQAYAPIYSPGGDSFRAKTAFLKAHAEPDDALLLHNSWQKLLLTYYEVDSVKVYTIPTRYLEKHSEALDEMLTEMFDTHDRVWVSYSSVEAVDPDWLVSQWLHEHTHRVLSFQNLNLYCAAPDEEPFRNSPEMAIRRIGEAELPVRLFLPIVMRASGQEYTYTAHADVSFRDRIKLEDVALAHQAPASGEAVLLFTRWRALQDISCKLKLRLSLVGPEGKIWADSYRFVGAFHISTKEWESGEMLIERSGLVIPVGTPPGDYRLRVQVFASDGDEWQPEGESFEVGGPIQVQHSVPPKRAIQALPGYEKLHATFSNGLELIGYEPGGLSFTQGTPVLFELYWRAQIHPLKRYVLGIEIVDEKGTVLAERHVQPVADWIPTDQWRAGEVFRGYYAVPLPPDAKPGRYRVQVSAHDSSGCLLSVDGIRSYKVLDWWERERKLSGTHVTLFDFKIEARPRHYRASALDHRLDAVFGPTEREHDVRLLGYDLSSSDVEPGEAIELTLYWKALRRMDRIYAAFAHLFAPGGIVVAQADSWLGGGTYHTTQWLQGEVVEGHYTILVPPDTPSDEYKLRVGMYNAANGERPVTVVDGRPIPERYVELTTISVSR